MSFSIKKVGVLASVLVGVVMFSTASSAATVTFAGVAGWAGNGNTIGGVTVTATGGDISVFADGAGVSGGSQDDEIDFSETITVAFDSLVNITSISFGDLWTANPDQAQVTINPGGSAFVFTVDANIANNGTSPAFTFDLTSIFTGDISSLVFSTGTLNSNYSLYSIDYTEVAAVPVPAAFWLLGSAMVFLFRKRDNS